MNDAEYEKQKGRVVQIIDKWRDALWLNSWRLIHAFERQERAEDRERGYAVAADVLVQWEYLCADFKWYLPIVALLADDVLEEYVVHEFGHVLVSEMVKGKKDPHEERVVTHLARVLTSLMQEKQKDAATEGDEVPSKADTEGACAAGI